MTKAIIIEDEIHGMNNLKAMLRVHCPDIQVIGEAMTNREAYELLTRTDIKPDIAFLDINLPDGPVFKVLNQMKEDIDFAIIFMTAYEKYALQACQYPSSYFILKPLHSVALKEAISIIKRGDRNERWQRFKDVSPHDNNPAANRKLSIEALDGFHFINSRDIIRCEAEANYTHIHLIGGKWITVSKTIKTLEDMLQEFNFHRVHKRHLINLNYIVKFVRGDGGYLIMKDGKQLEVSRRRRPALMERLRQLSINLSQTPNHPNTIEKLIIKAGDGIYSLNIHDIIYCEARYNYTYVNLNAGEHIATAETIKIFEFLLSDANFYRVNQQHLINLDHVLKFVKGNTCYVIMKDDMWIEVSPDRLGPFL